MKVHLILAISDVKTFIPSANKRSQAPLNNSTSAEEEPEENNDYIFVNVWNDDEDVTNFVP